MKVPDGGTNPLKEKSILRAQKVNCSPWRER